LGCAADPRRTAQTRLFSRTIKRCQVHVKLTRPSRGVFLISTDGHGLAGTQLYHARNHVRA
jgi:hypothetical protein